MVIRWNGYGLCLTTKWSHLCTECASFLCSLFVILLIYNSQLHYFQVKFNMFFLCIFSLLWQVYIVKRKSTDKKITIFIYEVYCFTLCAIVSLMISMLPSTKPSSISIKLCQCYFLKSKLMVQFPCLCL